MRRSFGLLLLVISLLWQSLALAGGRLLPQLASDAGHAALHWHDEAHHHHEDGSYEAHDTDDAAAHVHFDAASGGAALPAPSMAGIPALHSPPPVFSYLVTLPSPPPSGLRRPPRTLA